MKLACYSGIVPYEDQQRSALVTSRQEIGGWDKRATEVKNFQLPQVHFRSCCHGTMGRAGTSVAMMKVWIIPIVLLFIDATGCSGKNQTGVRSIRIFCEYFYIAFDVSTIQVRETTEYSVDIELVDKAHNLFVSFVKCNGTQTYTTENRVVVDREKSLVKESFPDGNDRVWISNLIPNCNYKCVVVQKNYMDHRGLSLVKFSTKYAGQFV